MGSVLSVHTSVV